MYDVCDDDRFEIIDIAKKRLIEDTNIEDSPEEMAVIDNILFRCWQMGWINADNVLPKQDTAIIDELKTTTDWIAEGVRKGWLYT